MKENEIRMITRFFLEIFPGNLDYSRIDNEENLYPLMRDFAEKILEKDEVEDLIKLTKVINFTFELSRQVSNEALIELTNLISIEIFQSICEVPEKIPVVRENLEGDALYWFERTSSKNLKNYLNDLKDK